MTALIGATLIGDSGGAAGVALPGVVESPPGTFGPNLGAATEVDGGGQVVPILAASGVAIVGGEVVSTVPVATLALVPVDLTAPVATFDPRSLGLALTDAGGGFTNAAFTADGTSSQNVITQAAMAVYKVQDIYGNVLDTLTNDYALEVELEVDPTTFEANQQMLVQVGIGRFTATGENLSNASAILSVCFVGVEDRGAGTRQITYGNGATNDTATAGGPYIVRVRFVPFPLESGENDSNATATAVWRNAGGYVTDRSQSDPNTGVAGSGEALGLFLSIGNMLAHSSANDANLKVSAVAVPIID